MQLSDRAQEAEFSLLIHNGREYSHLAAACQVHWTWLMADHGKHPFRVGERSENRKGLFTVFSIDEDRLAVRWDTGEEAISSVELQAKVLRNMERELLAGTTKKGCQAPKSYGELFRGLRAEDFTGDVTGTHWRAREQPGGAVTKTLTASEPFDSWSIYKRAEVHRASVARRGLVSALFQTKFFVRITPEGLLHGLYFERSDTTKTERPSPAGT